jgi:hypothetical protein
VIVEARCRSRIISHHDCGDEAGASHTHTHTESRLYTYGRQRSKRTTPEPNKSRTLFRGLSQGSPRANSSLSEARRQSVSQPYPFRFGPLRFYFDLRAITLLEAGISAGLNLDFTLSRQFLGI